MIHISRGNMKLGYIPNISLPPILSCPKTVPCKDKCYAMKAFRLYGSTKRAWEDNYYFYLKDPVGYFAAIHDFLQHKKPPRFRFHVGGDIIDAEYAIRLQGLAADNPQTRFMLYTKTNFYHLRLSNLSILHSIWLGQRVFDLDIAPAAVTVTKDAFVPPENLCPGSCKDCWKCWDAKPGDIVYFRLH